MTRKTKKMLWVVVAVVGFIVLLGLAVRNMFVELAGGLLGQASGSNDGSFFDAIRKAFP